MAEYSEEFAGYAKDFLDPDLSEEERITALYAAIKSCEEGEEDTAESKEPGETSKPKTGLALVFGGGKK